MATEKQVAANRANALHSTGPRTEAGKAAASQNATRHSLTSKYLIILAGQEDDFAELESGLRGKLNPNGPLEEVLFKRLVECAWNLERCRHAEFVLQAWNADDPLSSNASTVHYDRLHRYARESENSMYKAMRELGKLQSEQQFRHQAFPVTQEQSANPEAFAQPPHSISPVCSLAQVMKNLILYRKNTKSSFNIEDHGLREIARDHVSRIGANSGRPQPGQSHAAAA